MRGTKALLINLAGIAFFAVLAVLLSNWVPASSNLISGISDQWLFLAVGYYAVFSWATGLRERDRPTFDLTWGSPAFLSVIFGYGMVAFMAYAASYWGAPYAERTFADSPVTVFGWLEIGASKTALGWWLGAPGAVAGFVGVILGGRMADWLLERREDGRMWVLLFGLLAPIPPVIVAYTADNLVVFYVFSFFASTLIATALGAAAATSQALVLPRMRGVATATFFLATTLVGLGLGPFMAGYVSATNGDNLSLGVLSTLVAVPPGLILVLAAIKLVPPAASSVLERARAAGEDQLTDR
jgi:MFS family permease